MDFLTWKARYPITNMFHLICNVLRQWAKANSNEPRRDWEQQSARCQMHKFGRCFSLRNNMLEPEGFWARIC